MTLPIRIVKVGGSLFDLPDLRERLLAWIDFGPQALTVLLAGGGEMADLLRRAQGLHGLRDETAHWLCIEAMGLTAHWLAAVLEDSTVFSRLADLQQASDQGLTTTCVFDPRSFLKRDEAQVSGQRLPEDWSVTSDSIAARLAFAIQAAELILLKSQPVPDHEQLQHLADIGFVDAFFPQAAMNLPRVRFVNLRSGTQKSSPAV